MGAERRIDGNDDKDFLIISNTPPDLGGVFLSHADKKQIQMRLCFL